MKIDASELMKRAEQAESGEHFIRICKSRSYRIGVGARSDGSYFLEVLVSPFPNAEVDLDQLGSALVLLHALEKKGFKLCCQDESSISCELMVQQSRLEKEVEASLEMAEVAFCASREAMRK